MGGLLLLLGNLMLLKSFNFSFSLGDGLIFLAVLFWTAENVLAKYVLRDLPGNIVAWGRMFFGAIFILGYLVFIGQSSQILSLDLAQIKWIILTAILLFGYTITWYNGLKYVPVSVATTILLFGLPITTILTLVSTGKINPQNIFSGFLILTGLIIILGIKIFGSKTTKSLNH